MMRFVGPTDKHPRRPHPHRLTGSGPGYAPDVLGVPDGAVTAGDRRSTPGVQAIAGLGELRHPRS